MSNDLFPSSLPGFDIEVTRRVLPPKVAIKTTPSEREFRARDATLPRYGYDVRFNALRGGAAGELQQVQAHYLKHGGPFETFRFIDPEDRAVSDGLIGTGTGALTAFQLVRSIGGFSEPVTEPLSSAVSVDGVLAANLLPWSQFLVDAEPNGLCDSLGLFHDLTPPPTYGIGGVDVSNTHRFQRTQHVSLPPSGGAAGWTHQLVRSGASSYTWAVDLRGTPGITLAIAVQAWSAGFGSLLAGQETHAPAGSSFAYQRLAATVSAPAGTEHIVLYAWMHGGANDLALFDATRPQFQTGATGTAYSPHLATISAAGAVTVTPAPALGARVTWTGEFARRVRYDDSSLDLRRFLHELWDCKQVRLISTKGA